MPIADAHRWNERYLKKEAARTPRAFVAESAAYLPVRGLALDVAMGLGGNAEFLLARGLRVIGVDISEVAVRRAKARLPGLLAVVADLTRSSFLLPDAAFDVILNFYYLQRDLWPQYRRALKPGGVLVFETFTREKLAEMPEADPAFLLGPGELREAFSDWEVLAYREGGNSPAHPWRRAAASLVARRPAAL